MENEGTACSFYTIPMKIVPWALHLNIGYIGIERNSDIVAGNDPAFILGGLIYPISKSFDIDLGENYGLTSSETDSSVMA